MPSLAHTLLLLALPLFSLAATVVPAGTSTQIVPFGSLPQCAQKCGPLFDVQGGCTVSGVNNACFCADARMAPFVQGNTAGVCDGACPDDPTGLASIQKWVSSFCAEVKAGTAPTAATATTAPTAATTAGAPTGTNTGTAPATTAVAGGGASGAKKTWIESHYQYVIMIVVLAIAFIGGWIAAAFFRRRYLRKRELNYEMRPPAAPWVGGHTGPYGAGMDGMGGDGGKEMMTSAMSPAEIKKEKKKWVVTERT